MMSRKTWKFTSPCSTASGTCIRQVGAATLAGLQSGKATPPHFDHRNRKGDDARPEILLVRDPRCRPKAHLERGASEKHARTKCHRLSKNLGVPHAGCRRDWMHPASANCRWPWRMTPTFFGY